jgi:hypothetical protein
MFLEYPSKEFHSKFFVPNHVHENVSQDTPNSGTKLLQAYNVEGL